MPTGLSTRPCEHAPPPESASFTRWACNVSQPHLMRGWAFQDDLGARRLITGPGFEFELALVLLDEGTQRVCVIEKAAPLFVV